MPLICRLALLLAFSSFFMPSAGAMGSRPPEPPADAVVLPEELPPLTLEEAYHLALAQSEDLALRQADIDMTWANFLQATSEALGDIDYRMTDFRQEELQNTSTDGGATSSGIRPRRRENKFVISQPLFQGFKSLGALSGAGSLRKTREYEYERARQLLFLDVSDTFYTVLQSQEALEITARTVKLLNDRIGELSEREKIGRSRVSEVVTAQSRVSTLEASLARIRGNLRYQRRLLEFLTGQSLEGRRMAAVDSLPAGSESLDSYLLLSENRPDVEAARYALKTANRNIVVAQSQLWPTVTLDNNQYARREGFQSDIDWDLLITINIPLFQGGEALGKVKEALVNRKKSKLQLSRTERESETETKQAYDSLDARLDEYYALEKAVKMADENYSVQKEDYGLALVSNLDVLEALENLNEISLTFNDVRFELLKDYRRLQVASGDCCGSI